MNNKYPSPWRNPVLWVVVGVPVAAVAASIALIVLATRESPDAAPERVQRTAQVQVTDLGPDSAAQHAGLSAVVRSQDGIVQVLPVTGRFDRAQPLRITFLHPARAAADVALTLQPDDLGWRLPHELPEAHDWNVRIAPGDGRWRLSGRLPRGQHAAHLKPALQASP